MYTFWIINMVIPKHGIVWHIGLRMSLVAAVHRRKLDWIADEEYWKVVEYKILDTFFGIEFDRPSPYVTYSIAGAFLAADGRDAR